MEELDVLAEIEYTETLEMTATPYEPGIWRYRLYATGGILPFMVDTSNRTPITVNNVIIDHEEYTRFNTIEDMKRRLAEDKGGWVNGGSVVYVRFPHYHPPYAFFTKRYGTIMGFTNGSPFLDRDKGIMYRPGLLSTPKVSQSADVFTYDRMKFNSATVSIKNTQGQFDNFGDLFGNEFNLKIDIRNEPEAERPENLVRLIEDAAESRLVLQGNKEAPEEYVVLSDKKEKQGPYSQIKMLAQYYIANFTVKLEAASFTLKDKRERLSAKIPNRQFSEDELKAMGIELNHVDENVLDKDMQEAYGRCFGVPGVCLESKRIDD